MDGRKVGKVLRRYLSWRERDANDFLGQIWDEVRYVPDIREIDSGGWLGSLETHLLTRNDEKSPREFVYTSVPDIQEIDSGEWLGSLETRLLTRNDEKSPRELVYTSVPEKFFPRKCDAEEYVLRVFSDGMDPEEIVLWLDSMGG